MDIIQICMQTQLYYVLYRCMPVWLSKTILGCCFSNPFLHGYGPALQVPSNHNITAIMIITLPITAFTMHCLHIKDIVQLLLYCMYTTLPP